MQEVKGSNPLCSTTIIRMIEFFPTIEPSEKVSSIVEEPAASEKDQSCTVVRVVDLLKNRPGVLSKMITPLEGTAPETQTPSDIYWSDKGKPEHTYIGRI